MINLKDPRDVIPSIRKFEVHDGDYIINYWLPDYEQLGITLEELELNFIEQVLEPVD